MIEKKRRCAIKLFNFNFTYSTDVEFNKMHNNECVKGLE